MKIESLLAWSFACLFLFVLSFTVVPEFALWIARAALLMQAGWCLSVIRDRFRF
jgi:hypothetical protein